MTGEPLSEREHQILEAVIRTYVETAEPAGSRTVARRFPLGISPATVRNTMSDLEDKGYLYHPHTSAGRVPTDMAYRLYVDALMDRQALSEAERVALRDELRQEGEGAAIERLLRRAAQVLGLLTQELGIAAAPRLEDATLERLDLIPVNEQRVLLVMSLRAAGVRTVYVDVPAAIPASALPPVTAILNERLAGHTLREIRMTLPARLRDSMAAEDPGAGLLNVFLQSGEDWFAPVTHTQDDLLLGSAAVLAEQPEFASGERLKSLITLTERRDVLKSAVTARGAGEGLKVTIGVEHQDPALSGFTLVTSEYRLGELKGVIGVIGPTRMPYERVIAMVESTSALVSELLV